LILGSDETFDRAVFTDELEIGGGKWVVAISSGKLIIWQPALLWVAIFTTTMLLAYSLASRQSLEKEKAISATKSEFLTTMSHELRTPLNAILGYAQLLQHDAQLRPSAKDSVNEILQSGDHLLKLINEVLDLSKVESNATTFEIVSLNLKDAVDHCWYIIHPAATAHKIDLTTSVPEELFVKADQKALIQVILNLLSNAINYNREKGKVELTAEHVRGGMIRIIVEDSGKGIPQAMLGKVFDPFTRLDPEDKPGTGVGLTIVQKLIRSMDGKIGVQSNIGTGSKFWFELPEGEPVARSSRDATTVLALPSQLSEETFSVLYVEDNESNARLVQRILQIRENVTLTVAREGQAALKVAREIQPDLILLDINLPNMDGYEIFRKIRELDLLDNTPIIAMSANAMDADIKKAQKAGFDDYITKPLKIRSFLEKIDELIVKKTASTKPLKVS